MGKFVNTGIRIEAIATVVPNNYYGHEKNVQMFGEETVDKFEKITNIFATYKVSKHQTVSDLGYVAAVEIINKLKLNKHDIGVLVFASPAPDYIQPPTACVLQYRLGLPNDCAALDITHGCSSFPYGSQVVYSMMASSDCRYGLLIVGDSNSKNVNQKDNSYMLCSDAASAILFIRDSDAVNKTMLKTDGSRYKDIIIPGRGMRDLNPIDSEVVCSDGVSRSKYNWYMNGMNVFVFATRDVPKAVKEYLEWTDTDFEKYDAIAFHQANGIIIDRLVKTLKLKEEKVPNVIHDYGNTGGNSLLLALCEKYGNIELNKTIEVLGVAFGVGLSLGVTSFSINIDNIFPIIKTDNQFDDGIIELEDL
ncbi:MAG: ketoacyl-ACP synthase III [Lachnospiraceae bacterium]|nr:ketoacyl-ACP synthase III [Lachnospiraceae bacterium]